MMPWGKVLISNRADYGFKNAMVHLQKQYGNVAAF